MTIEEFIKAWPIIKKQVTGLRVPYLETFASRRRDPFQILISCILSLRTQDKTTEAASGRLFRLADTPEAMSRLSPKTIEKAIYPVGFYRVKARQIKLISRDVSEKYNSKVPDTIEELLTL
jgi:endonuclease-3